MANTQDQACATENITGFSVRGNPASLWCAIAGYILVTKVYHVRYGISVSLSVQIKSFYTDKFIARTNTIS